MIADREAPTRRSHHRGAPVVPVDGDGGGTQAPSGAHLPGVLESTYVIRAFDSLPTRHDAAYGIRVRSLSFKMKRPSRMLETRMFPDSKNG